MAWGEVARGGSGRPTKLSREAAREAQEADAEAYLTAKRIVNEGEVAIVAMQVKAYVDAQRRQLAGNDETLNKLLAASEATGCMSIDRTQNNLYGFLTNP